MGYKHLVVCCGPPIDSMAYITQLMHASLWGSSVLGDVFEPTQQPVGWPCSVLCPLCFALSPHVRESLSLSLPLSRSLYTAPAVVAAATAEAMAGAVAG